MLVGEQLVCWEAIDKANGANRSGEEWQVPKGKAKQKSRREKSRLVGETRNPECDCSGWAHIQR